MRHTRRTPHFLLLGLTLLGTAACAARPVTVATVQPGADTRATLRAGMQNAQVAARGLELVASQPRPQGFSDPADPGNILFANSDIAFQGNHAFVGSFRGFQVWDIADPRTPRLRTSLVCPGGQGDVSVHGNLLFMSVEMPNGRTDCREGEFSEAADPARFMGVRIFDISNIDRPRQVAAVQTCRGSHTHTLVTDPRDAAHVYIYVSGISTVRPATELAGCSGRPPEQDPNTAYFRIEVIRVPVANPEQARIVNTPRIFADARTGDISGLWPGGAHGPGTQTSATTDQCHDITAYPEIGLAGGACSGNGLLLDIRDPANPARIHEVTDPNFAYWHSATFNNDGTKLLFTDEWGGGMAARCQASDPRNWGANAIFDIVDRRLQLRSYYKLPVVQSAVENCVAHNGSMIPVPGRDIMVQAWYQGGISIFDFTDSANPVEIAYFDRGPYSASELMLGGFWSAYWYNGMIYGTEIGRGLDVLRLTPGEQLTQNEIQAASLVRMPVFNPQTQTRFTWPPSFVVARALLDQLRRGNRIAADRLSRITAEVDRIEALPPAQRRPALMTLIGSVDGLRNEPGATADARRIALLTQTLTDLANAPR